MADPKGIVLNAVAHVTKKDVATLAPNLRLAEDLGIRSLARIELAALVEDAAGVTLKNADVMRAKTIDDLIGLVGAPVSG